MWQALAVFAATLFLLGVDHSRWLGNVASNAKRFYALGTTAARRSSGVVGNKFTWLAIGLAAGMFAHLAIARLPAIQWPDWVTVVTPVVPQPSGELRVVIVREVNDKMTREQINAVNSTQVTAYLNEKCGKVDGRPGWRRWDDDVDVSNETEAWKALWTKAQSSATVSLPKVVIFKGDTMMSFAINTEADLLVNLKKYGG